MNNNNAQHPNSIAWIRLTAEQATAFAALNIAQHLGATITAHIDGDAVSFVAEPQS